ncbi:WYL domain-containing protein [bacterium]|nr:WYL domain-containing protein [bacterium]
MENLYLNENTNEITISTTLLRTLFLLKLLTIKPCNILEIKEILSKNEIIGSKISEDTIRLTISTLKSVGCEFAKPCAKNDFKYEIIKNPFIFSLNENDIDFLAKLREEIAPNISWEYLSKINSLYDKLNEKINNTENKFDISTQSLFLNIDLTLLDELAKLCGQKIYVEILYSSKNVLKNINIVPLFLKFENNSLYLWVYNEEKSDYSYLNVSRIKKINAILKEKEVPEIQTYRIEIYIKKDYVDALRLSNKVKVLDEDGDFCFAEVEYYNEFYIMQKVLELADNCKVLYPEDFKNKLIDKLEKMANIYEN